MAAVRHCRNVLLGLALLLAPALGMAQQAISPVVFTALNSAQQAQQKGDLAPAGGLELALIQQRLGYVAISAGQYEAAIGWLRKALAHDRLEPEAARQDRLNLAQLLASREEFAEAARLLEQERRQAGLNL